jgi:Na+/H+-dicarboxylate symporter
MQRLLLPNYYKRIGLYLVPAGFLMWCITQMGAFNEVLITNPHGISWRFVTVLSVSFFSFLFGLYFLAFSREKKEDEYIRDLRLQSFQLSGMVQLALTILSFVGMFVFVDNPDDFLIGLLTFAMLLFWIFYILHFNYTLYRNKKMMNEKLG